MSSNLRKKKASHVLVTGVEGALGAAVARCLLEQDPEVRVSGVAFRPDSISLDLKGNSRVRLFSGDLGNPDEVRRLVSEAQTLGGIDGLIHCAGGFRWSLLEKTPDADIDFLVRANLLSSVYLLRELLGPMKAQNFGRLALVSARSTQGGGTGVAAYTATKAGINLLVQSVAEEVKAHDITINAILPTILDTPANRRDMPQADFSQWVPLEEAASVLCGFLSPGMSQVNGALLPVAGRL
jgi:NAD(P)-dependent dehydrogenase (short-subunit alcohol dehydrogenase family)